MKNKIPSLVSLLLLFVVQVAVADDWFFRPRITNSDCNPPAVCDGKTYATAWRFDDTATGHSDPNIAAGAVGWSQMSPGETLYVCGFHDSGYLGRRLHPNVSGTENNPIVIDGNCPGPGGIDQGVLMPTGIRFSGTHSLWSPINVFGVHTNDAQSVSTGTLMLEIRPDPVTGGKNPDNVIPLVRRNSLPDFVFLTDNKDGTGSLKIAPQLGDAGVYQVLVTVNDGSFFDTEVVTITVHAAGTPPDPATPISWTGPEQYNAPASNPDLADISNPVVQEDAISTLNLSASYYDTSRLKFKGEEFPDQSWECGSFNQLVVPNISDPSTTMKRIHYKPSSSTGSAICDPITENVTYTGISNETGGIKVINQSYITVRNMRLLNSNNSIFGVAGSDHVVLENSELYYGGEGVSIGSASHFGEIRNNHIHDVGNGIYFHGTSEAQNSNNWVVSGNTINDISPYCNYFCTDNHAIGIQGGHNNLFEYNEIYRAGGSGITFYEFSNAGQTTSNNTVRYNYLHDIKDLRPNCVYTSLLGDGEVRCRNQRGIELGSGPGLPGINSTGNKTYYNLLADIEQYVFRYKADIVDDIIVWSVFNNVVVNSGTGAWLSRNIEFYNNIFFNSRDVHVNLVWLKTDPVDYTRYFLDNNLYYPDGLFRTWYLTNLIVDDDFATWKANSGGLLDSNSQLANPLLKNLSGVFGNIDDFNIVAGSPAINKGVSNGVTVDYDAHLILNAPDIGAFEFDYIDTDSDGLTDYVEQCHDGDCASYDPYDPVTNPGGGDTDTNKPDTDGDGYTDAEELDNGSSPIDPASVPNIIPDGDVNQDGLVNTADVLLAQRELLGLTTFTQAQIDHGDLYPNGTGDGVLTLSDNLLIIKAALGL